MSDYTTFRDQKRRNTSKELVQAIALRPAGMTVADVMDVVAPPMASRRVSAIMHKMAARGVLRKKDVLPPGRVRPVSLFTVVSKDRRRMASAPLPSLVREYLERHDTATLEEIAHGIGAPVRAVRRVLVRMMDGEEVQRTGPANKWRYELAPLEELPVIPFVSAIRARALGVIPMRKAA